MKITRVLLAANDNPIYYQFWNPISRIYSEKFGIKPTLLWFGVGEDLDRLGLSKKFGDIIVQTPIPTEHIGWQSAWAIFWFMSLYPDDVFCTMGIDQVPLSPLLFKDIPAPFSDDTYLMLADDAYDPSHWMKDFGTSPTAFHICRGSTANKVYQFKPSFSEEIERVVGSGVIPYYDHGPTKWGLDESYSSHKLRLYRDSGGDIKNLSLFKMICERRIECARANEAVYDSKLLKEGWYGDAHLCRPISDHKDYIENLLNQIPNV